MRKLPLMLGLAFLPLLVPMKARADLRPDSVAVNAARFTIVEALIKVAQARGTLPRLSNSQDGPALEAFWDPSAILGQPPYHALDALKLLNIQDKQTVVFRLYAKLNEASDAAPGSVPGGGFQDEVTRAEVFLLNIGAALMQAMGDYWEHLPERERTEGWRQQWRRVRLLERGIVSLIVQSLSSPDTSAHNVALLVPALSRTAGTMAGSFTRNDRAALATMVHLAPPGVDMKVWAGLRDFVRAMIDPACTGLCTVE